jgi:hypothetical protein
MKSKKIITLVLLLFVAVSVAYLVANSSTTGKGDEYNPTIKDPNSLDVLVYYIHNNTRCINCIRFEKYTKDVINDVFDQQVKEEKLVLKILNYENSENYHYVTDYNLVTKAVIVAKMKDGKQTEWKNLDKIWVLVNDEAAFKKYITDEVANYLGAD